VTENGILLLAVH